MDENKFQLFVRKCILWFDRETKVFFFIYGFFVGVIATICLSFSNSDNATIQTFLCKYISYDSSIYGVIAGVVGTITGIFIPISNQTVTDHLKPYYHPSIVGIFRKERIYKLQFINAFILLIFSLILLIWRTETKESLSSPIKSGITLFTALYFLWAVFCFWRFVMLVSDYTINTEEEVIKKLKKNIGDVIDRK